MHEMRHTGANDINRDHLHVTDVTNTIVSIEGEQWCLSGHGALHRMNTFLSTKGLNVLI
jgi:hypothetical protein